MKKEDGMNWRTHDVFNQFSELSDYNLFTTDRALTEALGRCADWSSEQLTTFGVNLGSAGTYALADNEDRAIARQILTSPQICQHAFTPS
jgi:putative acyl-CoA dehydrogenase